MRAGHYYAGRGNPFWPTLYESGVVPEPFDYPDDRRIIEFGIGLTDLVKRPTKTIEELKREDFAEGRIVLSRKLEEFLRAWWPLTESLPTNNLPSANAITACRRKRSTARRFLCCRPRLRSPHEVAERVKHFRKLAQLVVRSEKTREAQPR